MSNCCSTDGSCNTTEIRTTYKVDGVGSAHCQGIVTKAVGGLDGISAVEVEIGTGLVTVTTATEPDETLDALIARTVDEAGYDYAGRTAA
ncbi:heavy-metal-associated domain-containing protein [Streptomyces sp. NPDC088789]|uniref:heavy-metal-associated domain-containing protein n=1 Tax=Streptomyces sp. NPDC088789 TaxID=3365899 RepID=UPI0038133AC4